MTQLRRSAVLRFLTLAVLAGLVVACADNPPAPIEDRSRGGTARPEQRYTVLRGDTLYSIAFRYGLDYRRLAAANAIPAPYTIYPGQTLALREADPPRVAPAPSRTADAPKSSGTGSSRSSTSTSRSGSAPAPAAPAAPKPKTGTATPAPKSPTVTPVNIAVSSWTWPASGRVARGFDTTLHKGIDITGRRGDPVKAAAGGRVVYAGDGIAGYGLLVIVRHNDEFLSAYGHNDEVLVPEGAVVRAGQTIARFGSSGTDTVKLHFEIRRGGRPVDPRRLLPKR